MKKTLTAEEVKKLGIGAKVNLCGHDRYGYKTWLECEIAQSGNRKMLKYWDYRGVSDLKPIRDYPGKWYEVDE